MKRISRRIISFIMALTFILTSFSISKSYAQETQGSITVNNATDGKTYGAYKIFDLTYSGEGKEKSVSYTINPEWKEFFNGEKGQKYIVATNTENNLNPIVVDGNDKYINITENNIAEFAKDAQEEISSKTKIQEVSAASGVAKFSGLALGYYLVHPQGASEAKVGQNSIVSLTSTLPNGEINAKGDYPTIEKTVNKKSADIGEKVTFTVSGKVPDTRGYNEYEYTLEDTLSKGLLLDKNSVKVLVGSNDITSKATVNTNNDQQLLVTLNKEILKTLKVGDEIKLTYEVEITKDAVIGNGGNLNEVDLTYSKDPKDKENKDKTPKSKVKVYTGKIKVKKTEKGKEKVLEGAQFVLKNSLGKFFKQGDDKKVTWVESIDQATKLTTDKSGNLSFEGLKAGKYALKETKAPKGYNLLTSDTEVSLSDNDSSDKTLKMEAESKVENSTGLELPKTGGKGTKIFTVVGGLIIFYVGFTVIKDKRKSLGR